MTLDFFLFASLLIIPTQCLDALVMEDPFTIGMNDTISSLYAMVNNKLSRRNSIIFGNTIILELVGDHRTVSDIGMHEGSNHMQFIQKPDFVALLEMVSNIENKKSIPWFGRAMLCLSDSSSNDWFESGGGLYYDSNNNLITVDLSHLNLTGALHLASLPPTVRSLDLSFNDLHSLNLEELRGKSVERLNVENNPRCHINTECFQPEQERTLSIKVLQCAFDQIFPWITNLEAKHNRIRNWLDYHPNVDLLVVDRVSLSLAHFSQFHTKMLRVIEGIANKEVIPWYQPMMNGPIQPDEWEHYRVDYKRGRGGHPARYKFDLSGLGLLGHIQLFHLPRNVRKLDLSNNNLSSISFVGEGQNCLEELDLQNNPKLRIDLTEIERSSVLRCFCRLSISSNQLDIQGQGSFPLRFQEKIEFVQNWLHISPMTRIIVDDIRIRRLATPSPGKALSPFTIFVEPVHRII